MPASTTRLCFRAHGQPAIHAGVHGDINEFVPPRETAAVQQGSV
ncbi:hypothetical protein L541_3754, partial [Bordetella hinzii CA90 BAL1384]